VSWSANPTCLIEETTRDPCSSTRFGTNGHPGSDPQSGYNTQGNARSNRTYSSKANRDAREGTGKQQPWLVKGRFQTGMSSHKFKLGEFVDLTRVPGGFADPRPYEIVRLLASIEGVPRYVIKAGNEDHERVVLETDLRGYSARKGLVKL
jgi:hypothetical protein